MLRMTQKVFIFIFLTFDLIQLHTTAQENSIQVDNDERIMFGNETCVDDLPIESCAEIIYQDNCNVDDLNSWNCRQSCQYCTMEDEAASAAERDSPDNASKCKNLLPFCDVVANPAICCQFVEIANKTCQKACLFCYEIDIPLVSSIPAFPMPPGKREAPPMPSMPGMPNPSGGGKPEKPVVYPNPCNPASGPPGVSGVPGVAGGGQSPIGG